MNRYLKALGASAVLTALLLLGIAWAAPSVDKSLVYARATSLSANTDALPSDVVPNQKTSLLRVWVSPGTASVFNYTIDDGTTEKTIGLNSSNALSADDQHVFDIPAVGGFSYNFQFETTQSSGFPLLKIQEIVQ